ELGRLRELNPALTRGITPPNGLYSVFVPCGEGTRAQQVIASIPAADRIKRLFHTVRAGDTLAALSRRYGVPVETIMAANGIKNPRSLQIGRELLIPKGAWNRAVVAQLPKGTKARAQTSHTAIRYRVKPGDTLYSIAREHGLSVATIQARNNLTGTVIRPGDILLLAP
ncbi:MAG: LysM peptidoglycan-binding domain-containing protein, partial [Thermoanaerobaculum sp.]|nr:LysM peptidoglycan-binding domain-containing protein [Thermoanaerobaculum sp.]